MTVIAVVDTETSRHPSHRPNRIVEIGIVLWDAESDAPIAEIETLVNPNSVMEEDSSRFHGLVPSDLEGAPSFREIAAWLPHFLDERIVCGFEVSFDSQILNYELSRAGSDFKITQTFCARYGISGNNKRLEKVCEDQGFKIKNAHTALGDARATLQVLRNYGLDRVLEESKGPKHRWISRSDDLRPLTWSRYKAGLTNEFDLYRENSVWELEGLTPESQYMGLISSVFEDRKVSKEEGERLESFARQLGLSGNALEGLHKEYLGILEARARENGVVSQLEVNRISHMAGLLGLKTSLTADEPPAVKLSAGSLVCVTSEATVFGKSWSFESLSLVIEKMECRPTNQLNKKGGVSLLLCPEVHARTGKAKKAVNWGIPMMSFADFLEMAIERGVLAE